MTRHLTKCRATHPQKGKPHKTFHLLVEGQYLPEYWLHLEAPAKGAFMMLDGFLRDIWLECCGHILARNHPPPIGCSKCNQRATDVCVECMDGLGGWLCASHAEKHKHQDMFLSVVNSPRVGQCGYTGSLED